MKRSAWRRQLLGELVVIASGQVDPRVEPYSKMLHVGGDNIESETGKLFGLQMAQDLRLVSGKYEFTQHDLLYSKIRPNLNKVALPDFAGICSADIYPIRPKANLLTREYLAHVLRSQEFLSYAAKHSSRTNIPKINRESLSSYEFLLPPLAEQKRIAAILDKADGIRRKRREAQTLLASLHESAFLELFGDPAVNRANWPVVAVGQVLAKDRAGTKCGPFGTALTKAEYVREGIPVWGIENVLPNRFREEGSLFITPDKFTELQPYSVESGDLLISRAGTVGRICVARPTVRPSIIGTNLIRVAVDATAIFPEYLASLLTYFPDRVGGLRASSDDAAYSFMKTSVLTGLNIPLPAFATQQRYVEFLDRITDVDLRFAYDYRATEDLFNSLVQRAFRGDL